MKPGTGFSFAVSVSIITVAVFGSWSISRHVKQYGKAQLADELPVGEVRDTLEELKARTASSLKEFIRLAQEAKQESATSTPVSIGEFQEGMTVTATTE